jgi:hypothetical protein
LGEKKIIRTHGRTGYSVKTPDVALDVYWYWSANRLRSEYPQKMDHVLQGKLSSAGLRELVLDFTQSSRIPHRSIIGGSVVINIYISYHTDKQFIWVILCTTAPLLSARVDIPHFHEAYIVQKKIALNQMFYRFQTPIDVSTLC